MEAIPRCLSLGLRDNPDSGAANSSSKASLAGRTMRPGRALTLVAFKANGSVVCGSVMAETMATLAFLSALAMFISPLIKKGKWLASVTATLSLLAFDSIAFGEAYTNPEGQS